MVQQDLTPATNLQNQQRPLSLILKEMLDGMRISRAIYVAAEFGIADLLKEGPKYTVELATETKTNEDFLYRLLRALASVNIFQEVEPHCFAQTPLSILLQSDQLDSMRNMALMLGDTSQWHAWEGLAESIRTGKPAFDLLFGMDLWQYFSTVNPHAGKIFDRAMTDRLSIMKMPIAQAYDFSTSKTLVDVGGGQGSLISTILSLNAGLHGVLFDRPEVITHIDEHIQPELKSRLTLVGGDFFQEIPAGGDVYMMSQIIHNWTDDHCQRILQNCRDVMKPGGRILTIERLIIPGGPETAAEKFLDLHIMVNQSGRERTEAEFATLYERCGFQLKSVIPTHSPFFIIEGEVVTSPHG